jgi:RNA polymerase sigma-70 factor (ECF subfamily)
MTDFDAVQLAQQNQPEGLAVLYQRYRDLVYRRCLRLTRSPELAEDLTQNVFLELTRKLPSFENRSKFSTWLFRVATTTALMRLRQKPREFGFEDAAVELTKDYDLPGRERRPSANHQSLADRIPAPVSDPDARILLEQALRRVDRKLRPLLRLQLEEGLTYEEIGARLNLPLSTVAGRFQQLYAQLRAVLA